MTSQTECAIRFSTGFGTPPQNFFGLHAGALGSSGVFTTSQGARVAAFPGPNGFLQSGQSFVTQFRGLVTGKSDPTSFARALVPQFNTASARTGGNPDFVQAATGAIGAIGSRLNCPQLKAR